MLQASEQFTPKGFSLHIMDSFSVFLYDFFFNFVVQGLSGEMYWMSLNKYIHLCYPNPDHSLEHQHSRSLSYTLPSLPVPIPSEATTIFNVVTVVLACSKTSQMGSSNLYSFA